jgi:hypothetical protein
LYIKNSDAVMTSTMTASMGATSSTGSQFQNSANPGGIEKSKKIEEMIDTKSKATTSDSSGFGKTQVLSPHCKHGPQAKCVNCLGVTKDNAKFIRTECKHADNQKCANCLGVTSENAEEIGATCSHGPNEKCPNCTGKDFIKDVS